MSAIESRSRHWTAAFILTIVAALSGCAHNTARDPLEPFNRGVYAFNETVDDIVLKPLATGYRAALPQFARTGVRNFFSNLDDITVIINSLLQFKIPQAVSDTGRFVINSTVGLLGLVDVATHLGLEKHNEDFGQTLGYWGVGSGAYLVLPFFGPSSVRDGIGRLVDIQTDVVVQLRHIRTRNILIATRAISDRSQLLDSEKIIEAAALDRYVFIREAYLQRRRNLVYDGNPPPEPEDDLQPPAKPRSDSAPGAPEPAAVLVDQFGAIVAGPAAGAPTETGAGKQQRMPDPAPSRSTPSQPVDPRPAADTNIPAKVSSVTPAAEAAAATLPVRTDADQPAPRIVRVWLSGTGTR